MKKFTVLLTLFLLIGSITYSQSELLVGWTFPGNSLVADTGLSLLPDNEITTIGGTSAIEFKNGFTTNAAQATEWNQGMGEKAWMIRAKTTGYNNLTISSRQQSGGEEPGPKFFEIQYSINYGSSWLLVNGGEIIVENDWETSFVDKLSLPSACEDKEEIWIRWVMALNIASGNGGSVAVDGKSKIDEIFLHGDKINGIEDHLEASFTLFPNPASDFVEIRAKSIMTNIVISDLAGKKVFEKNLKAQVDKINISDLAKGNYIISIKDKDYNHLASQKLLIN